MKKILLTILATVAITGIKAQSEPAYLDDILLQSFGWDEYNQPRNTNEGGLYEFYYSRAGNLKALGFDMIWMPPPSKSTGGVGYFPTELYNFSNTSWGTEAQLRKMLLNMNARGINPIADVVANHRSGTTGWTDFTNPTWGCDAIVSNDEATAAYDSGTAGVTCKPSGAADTGEGFDGSRDMDHTNPVVQSGYKEFLTRLKELGFKGWRWDVAKGFSPSYFGMYIKESQPYYSVGENWDGNVDVLKSWINGTYAGGATVSGAFDFALYYNMSNTFATANASNNYNNLNWSGAMAGLAGQFGFAEKAVTFVDNHDTFVQNSAFLGANIPKAYTYILTHPGIPSVFAPHYFGGTYTKDGVTRTYSTANKPIIEKLMAIRKSTGIDAYSHINIDKSENGIYAAYILKRSGDAEPKIAMKIGPYDWTPAGGGWTQVISSPDNEYAVWTKTAVNVPPVIQINEPSGTYSAGASKSISITATDDSGTAPVIRYTTDGSEPTSASAVYSGPFTINATSTVKAIAFDNANASSGVVERNYTFATPSTQGIVIRFNPSGSGWTQPYIHYWNVQPAGTIADANWNSPVAMTPDPYNPGWFTYTFAGATSVNFLFRNGSSTGTPGSTQTRDINNVTQNNCYVWDATSSNFVRTTDCSALNLATGETDAKDNKTTLQITQNPVTNGEMKVKYTNANRGVLHMFDMSGKAVGSYKLSSNSAEETFRLNGVKAGIYVVQLKSDSGTAAAKVIVK